MNATCQIESEFETKAICNVVVIYEDVPTRQRAMSACDFLMQQLWSEVEFEFHWWRTDFLEQPEMAQVAAEQAARADFVIFCCRAEGEVSPGLRAWCERWIEERQGRDGALLNLTEGEAPGADVSSSVETFLRGVARLAMLDYFTTVRQTGAGTLPGSFEEVERRASEISSVLDEILHQPPRPPSFGLND
jgi:hypothetical protein